MASGGSKRVLVRWSDDHDKELLLWIVFCCAESGIKIPFDKVAYYMGPNFSEGAIVQHLAKVRTKMEESGLHCPPSQKRGTVTRTPSKLYGRRRPTTGAAAPRPASMVDDDNVQDGEDGDDYLDRPRGTQQPTRRRQSTAKPRRGKRDNEIKQESLDDGADGFDNDPEADYGAGTGGKRKTLQTSDQNSSKKKSRASDRFHDGSPGNHMNLHTGMGSDLNQQYSRNLPTTPGSHSHDHAGQWLVQHEGDNSSPSHAPRSRGVRNGRGQIDQVNSEDEEEEAGDFAGHARGPLPASSQQIFNETTAFPDGHGLPAPCNYLPSNSFPQMSGFQYNIDSFDFGGYDIDNRYAAFADYRSPYTIHPTTQALPRPTHVDPQSAESAANMDCVSRNLSWSSGMTTDTPPSLTSHLGPMGSSITNRSIHLASYMPDSNNFNHGDIFGLRDGTGDGGLSGVSREIAAPLDNEVQAPSADHALPTLGSTLPDLDDFESYFNTNYDGQYQ